MASETGTGDEETAGRPGCPPRTGRVRLTPGHASRRGEHHDHGEHPEDDHQTGLDAYIARLVDAAPPVTSEQRDTLALLLRVPHRR